MRGLTDRQMDILRFAFEYQQKNGFSPAIREIGGQFEIHSLRGVTVHLDSLQRKGMILRTNVARGIVVTLAGRTALGNPPTPCEEAQIELGVLKESLRSYRDTRRAYEALGTGSETRTQRTAMAPNLAAARRQLFCLLADDDPNE